MDQSRLGARFDQAVVAGIRVDDQHPCVAELNAFISGCGGIVKCGFEVASCTAARLMREMGLAGIVRGRAKRTAVSDKAAPWTGF
jgi:hypothetical protein